MWFGAKFEFAVSHTGMAAFSGFRCLAVAVMLAAFGVMAQPQQLAHIPEREAMDHLLGNAPILRADVPGHLWAVYVRATTDVNGDVVSASALKSGNDAAAAGLMQLAVGVVMKLRYRPFERGGRPVAGFFDVGVEVLPPEIPVNANSAFPEVHDWHSVSVRLTRGVCLGFCPDYEVKVTGDGAVDFSGGARVAFPGPHHARISHSQVLNLLQAFRQADFFALQDNYGPECCDAPVYTVALSLDGRRKQVRDYMGLQAGMPAAVADLENRIDQVTDSGRWVKGDENTIPSLKAEGWDFTGATTCATLQYLAEWGNAAVIPGLLDAGVSLQCAPTAIIDAARRADTGVLASLLAAGGAAGPAVLNQALLASAAGGKLTSVQLFLGQGADPRFVGSNGSTLLIAAASSGAPAVMQVALGYGLDVNARDDDGDDALIADLILYSGDGEPDGIDRTAVARLLLDHGADPNQRGKNQSTALLLAASDPERVRLLIEHGAQVNVEDENGCTPLMNTQSVEVAKLLLRAGADPNYRNRKGQTIFDDQFASAEVIAYLKTLGAHGSR